MLPEKWQVRVTQENKGILGKWRDAGTISRTDGFVVSYGGNAKGYWYTDAQEGYTEISFEDFKKYVLKENIETIYEIY